MKWLALLALAFALDGHAQERVLDDFASLAPWTISATDDVKAALRSADGPNGSKALCIDYDFGHVTGYVTAQRALPLDFPPRYEFALNVRGDAPPNALQFKLVDAIGENVWWAQRPEYRFPHEWQTLKIRQPQIGFAWGPTVDRTLLHSASLELVIASGSGAGKGTACFDQLVFRRLPDTPSPDEPREFDALTLRWPPGQGGARYDIQFSLDGARWRTARHVNGAHGDVQHHWLPESEARAVRVVGAAVAPEIETFAASNIDAYFTRLARLAPRGHYPRAYVGEQAYWTVLGVDGAKRASLLGEDGALEPVPGAGALEPLLVADGKLLSWADARITQSLRDGDLPMPAVHWVADDLALDVEAFGQGTPAAAQVLARYSVRNLGTRARRITLALAWRPFQVNPPTQFLAYPGGASEVRDIAWDGHALSVNGEPRVQPLTAPDGVRLAPLDAGPAPEWLSGWAGAPGSEARAARVADPLGYASGVLRFVLQLQPGERREIVVALPTSGTPPAPAQADVRALERHVAAEWRERLGRVRVRGPADVTELALTLRAALGHILVNRSGPALQPGARAYARSWIRDGAMTSAALLRLGHDDVARDFLRWYAPFQFKNGKVPCCATERGADPVPENDSHGELAYALADYWRYTQDEATARALWPHVRAAIDYMQTLRTSERSEANRAAGYFGLMPPSISHEGYSDRPAYAYWDDFWAYTGYRSAAEIAQALRLPQDAERIGAQRDAFRADLLASIDTVTRRFRLDVLPGAADRGDFDPTSSTIALTPAGLLGTLPDALVRNTWARYWREFEARRADEATGKRHGDGAYTPYEWRNVGALVRLGERERAQQALAYFYRDRRPAGWRQWAEVVPRDAREPRFLGDMPHGWVASDQIRSVLDLFAYEHEGDHALVLAAGVPMAWLDGPGLSIEGLRTPYGPLSWQARRGPRGTIEVNVRALRAQPPGGISLRGPWPADARVWIDGRPTPGAADAIPLTHTPARVRIELR